MEIAFKDICGHTHHLQVPANAKVSDVCKLLSPLTGFNENQIFLVSTDENKNFYQDNECMDIILNENPDYILFMKHFSSDHNHNHFKLQHESKEKQKNHDIQFLNQKQGINYSYQNLVGSQQKSERSLKVPCESFFNISQNVKNWQYSDVYEEYSTVVREMPADFQERVDMIAELGYSIDDIKEALRTTNYDVMVAIHLLVLVTSNQHHEEGEEYASENEIFNDDSEVGFYNESDDKQNITISHSNSDENSDGIEQ